jgi:hypothetical protein
MGFLIFYLSGVIFVLASIFMWNRFAMKGGGNNEFPPEVFSLPTALMAAIASLMIVIMVALLAIASFFTYLVSESEWSERANQWFTNGGAK